MQAGFDIALKGIWKGGVEVCWRKLIGNQVQPSVAEEVEDWREVSKAEEAELGRCARTGFGYVRTMERTVRTKRE
jgi:hypothetical protein